MAAFLHKMILVLYAEPVDRPFHCWPRLFGNDLYQLRWFKPNPSRVMSMANNSGASFNPCAD